MWFSLSDQTAYFLWSLVMGLVLALLYDLVRAGRMLLRAGQLHMTISDILFFGFCGVLTSLFALPFNKGDVRAFIVFGEAVGFLTYRLTLGTLTGRFYSAFARFIRWICKKICKFIQKIFDLLLKAGTFVVYNVGVLVDKLQNVAGKYKRKHTARREAKRSAAAREDKDIVHEQSKRRTKRGKGKYQGRHRHRKQRKRR